MEIIRSIPEDNLVYPVAIKLDTGASGTGFYVKAGEILFLVTAKHNFFDKQNNLLTTSATLNSFKKSIDNDDKNEILIDLIESFKHKLLQYHILYDFAVIKIGYLKEIEGKINFMMYNTMKDISKNKMHLTGVNVDSIKKYHEVIISNDVFIIGYPSSLGNPNNLQYDNTRPLLRRGIVAGKYEQNKTIILDVPLYPGNSGGPVIEVNRTPESMHWRTVGIAVEFIPFYDEFVSARFGFRNLSISNSGYSVCVSMDPVLEMIAEMK